MRPNTRRWSIVGIVTIVAVGVAIIAFLRWANSTADGTVSINKATAPTVKTTEPLTIQTPYFTSRLPSGFGLERQNETPNAPTLLQLTAVNDHQQFAVTFGTLPPEGLQAIGDYNLRTSAPSDYVEYRPAGLPVAATAFRTVADPAAFTVFWPHGAQYAQITLSSDGTASLGELFATFTVSSHSWQWK